MEDTQQMEESQGFKSQEGNDKRSVTKQNARGYHIYKAGKFDVKFPFEPYKIQKFYMFNVVRS